jgi:hypothetical protein
MDCAHFKPMLVGSIKNFGRCSLYKEPDGKIGYADCARIDQFKCGPGAAWFTPKKKKTIFILNDEDRRETQNTYK